MPKRKKLKFLTEEEISKIQTENSSHQPVEEEIIYIKDIDNLYPIISDIQSTKKPYTISVPTDLAPVVENIIKDAEITFQKRKGRKNAILKLEPNFNQKIEDCELEDLEEEFFSKDC